MSFAKFFCFTLVAIGFLYLISQSYSLERVRVASPIDTSTVGVIANSPSQRHARETSQIECNAKEPSAEEGWRKKYIECGERVGSFLAIPLDALPNDCNLDRVIYGIEEVSHSFGCEEGRAYGRKGSNINFTHTKGATLTETEQSFANDKQEKFIKGFLWLGQEGAMYGTFLGGWRTDVRESTPWNIDYIGATARV
jgi:hypothetical protein